MDSGNLCCLRILVVEDSEDDYILIRDMLSDVCSQCEIDRVHSRSSALEAISRTDYDVCLLSHPIGWQSGLDLLREIRTAGSALPAILLTGQGSYEVDIETMKAGAADCLSKDQISAWLLGRSIRYAIERSRLEGRSSEAVSRACSRQWDATFEAINTPLALADLDGRFLQCNAAMAKLLGKPAEEIIGRTCRELVHNTSTPPQDGCPLLAMRKTLQRESKVLQIGDRWIEDTVYPVLGDDGSLVGAVHVMADISERLEAERAIRDEHLFREAVENSVLAGITAVDLKGRQLYVNSAFCEMVGWSEEELLGKTPPFPYLPEEETKKVAEYLNTTSSDRDRRGGVEVKFRRRNGEDFDALVLVSALTDHNGTRIGWVASINDISERKKMEKALRKSERQLRFLSSKLLSVHEAEKARLAQELHDYFGQTLAAIKFSVETALQTAEKGGLNEAIAGLRTIVPMVQKTLEEMRRTYMNLRPTILDDLGVIAAITWFCREFERIHPDIRIDRSIEAQENDIPEALKIVIFRIVQEALTNMATHSNASFVRLSLRRTDATIEATVADDGLGFDMKKELSAERPDRGLGLASMMERTRLSGGELQIESALGKGTVIRALWNVKADGLEAPQTGRGKQ